MNKPGYYEIVESMTTPEEIISRNIKTQTLNTMSVDISSVRGSTTNKLILNKLDYLVKIIEDAYLIDMYRFQFKIFTDILVKEIVNVKNAVATL